MTKIYLLTGSALLAMTLAAAPAIAQMKNDAMKSDMMKSDSMKNDNAKPVTVGGAPMYSNKNIVQNAVNSKDHTTLVAAVKAAGLVDTLSGAGPFTVFAPTNEAFKKLPAGTVDTLLKPENKDKLKAVLTYHVVAGKMSAKDLMEAVKKGGGKAMLKTVEGDDLTVTQNGNMLTLTDAKGHKAKITVANVNQSNGVIHVIDTVMLPG